MYLEAVADLCWPNLNCIQNKFFYLHSHSYIAESYHENLGLFLWINPNLYGGHISPDQPEGVGKYLLDSWPESPKMVSR